MSQGYATLLAIAALCALRERSHEAGLGLLVLDELAQSLDPETARRVGEALGRHAPAPVTVVTCMDEALAAAVAEGAGADRTRVYRLPDWSEETGTVVRAAER